MINFLQNPLPIAEAVERFVSNLTEKGASFFGMLQASGQFFMDNMTNMLLFVPPIIFIIIMGIIAYFISNRKKSITIFTIIGLLFIYNQGLWTELMFTVTLVIISSILSIIIGVPLGILMAKSENAQSVITPILDFMQTMPGFVYLIPAVAFFGIGMVPGVFASIIFALPPTVRFTNLGIRQVPLELVEASDSFGGTASQKLFKVELPLAKRTIFAGINQTIMLALSMVVIASMIGAPGLGRGVISALQRAQVGNGFVSGLSLVILAIIIDRFTQYINKEDKNVGNKKKNKATKFIFLIIAILFVAFSFFFKTEETNRRIKLAYVEWDTEVASTNVIATVLEDMGYEVNVTPLDNAIMWESIASGESDAMVAAWLPSTHKSQYEKYQDKFIDLGANLTGAKVGLAVPTYMNVNSIEDLRNEADMEITGIEPGAGIVAAAEKTVKTYPNLDGWSVKTSSSGAMTVALGQAMKNKEPIIITAWSPHWMFAKYDLKYLDDPRKTMGEEERIHTIVRKSLDKDMPEAFKILDNFKWEKSDSEEVMLKINAGLDPKAAAREWIEKNKDRVESWKK